MQVNRVCCDGQGCKKPNFKGFTERASEKICNVFNAPNALALHLMGKKGATIDYNPEKDCFYIVGRLNEKGAQCSANVSIDQIRDLINEAKKVVMVPWMK